MPSSAIHPSSYRDPAGFLFYQDGELYRQVNKVYAQDYDLLMKGGLYEELVHKEWMIPHQETAIHSDQQADAEMVIKPEYLPFISYPYEWCFDQWKEAALLTLSIAKSAMRKGMMLKDASAYNIQWRQGKMIFIDTLSFIAYDPAQPWIAYRQFCEHFLAPLALMHYLQTPIQPMFQAWPDGLPLDMVRKMLPWTTKFHLHTYLHIHLHGGIAAKASSKPAGRPTVFSARKMEQLLSSLETAVQGYVLKAPSGVWSGYYDEARERKGYVNHKKLLVREWTKDQHYHSSIDLGANEGVFARIIAERSRITIATDFDHYSVNRLYQQTQAEKIPNILPLCLDLSHPSPALGVNNEERAAFTNRSNADLVMALALIHHLAIGKNMPFDKIARLFRLMGRNLIVEFVPKEDEKVQFMLQQKADIYTDYTEEDFLTAFERMYRLVKKSPVQDSPRTLYYFEALD